MLDGGLEILHRQSLSQALHRAVTFRDVLIQLKVTADIEGVDIEKVSPAALLGFANAFCGGAADCGGVGVIAQHPGAIEAIVAMAL